MNEMYSNWTQQQKGSKARMSQDVVWGFLCTVRILKNIAGWKPLKTWDDEWL